MHRLLQLHSMRKGAYMKHCPQKQYQSAGIWMHAELTYFITVNLPTCLYALDKYSIRINNVHLPSPIWYACEMQRHACTVGWLPLY